MRSLQLVLFCVKGLGTLPNRSPCATPTLKSIDFARCRMDVGVSLCQNLRIFDTAAPVEGHVDAVDDQSLEQDLLHR